MTQEQKRLIFILDTEGDLGFLLSQQLIKESTIVFATKKQVPQNSSDSFFKIHLTRKIPTFPNVLYTHFVLFLTRESKTLDYVYRCIKKAKIDKAECYVVVPYAIADVKLIRHLTWLYRRVTVVIRGDVFGRGIAIENRAVELLRQAQEEEGVVVYENGLTPLFPVYDKDIKDVLYDYIYGRSKEQRVLFAMPKHFITELAFAHTLHKINPNIQIDYSTPRQKKKKESFQFEMNGESVLQDPYPYEKKLRESNMLFLKKDLTPVVIDEQQKKSFPSSVFRFVLIFLISILVFPMLSTLFLTFSGAYSLRSAKHAFLRGEFAQSKRLSSSSSVYFTGALKTSEIVSFQVTPLGFGGAVTQITRLLYFGEDVSTLLTHVSQSVLGFVSVVKGESTYPQEDFLESMSTMKKSLILARDIEAKYQDIIKGDVIVPFVSSKNLKETSENLQEAKQYITLVTSTFEVAPQLMGFDKEKKYLLLFQNNMELRPGGGFIGSYALAKVKDGSMSDFSIHDVYDADGKLKGHIEPPMPIRRYLPSVHWYLRDSNFNVDFSKSASVSAMILQEETGESVDGVIGMDISFIKLLLQAIGPVEVSEYNETVTHDNVYLLTQKHAEWNFFPGSTQKKDFLRLLSLAISQKLEGQNLSYGTILQVIGKAVLQKHLVVAFSDSTLQNVFTVNGMSNSLWDGRSVDRNTITDYLGINEANIGVNKANYFIKRKVEYITKLIDSRMQSTVKVRFKNDSKALEWPGGDYKNYIRFIVPYGSLLQEISIDGNVMPYTKASTDPKEYEAKNFKPPKELEVESYVQEGKTVFGFLLTVPTTQSKIVSMRYMLPYSILESKRLLYTLKLLKQPGVDEFPFALTVDFPPQYKIIQGERKKEVTIEKDEVFEVHVTAR